MLRVLVNQNVRNVFEDIVYQQLIDRKNEGSNKGIFFVVPETSKAVCERILIEIGKDVKQTNPTKCSRVGVTISDAILMDDVVSFVRLAKRILSITKRNEARVSDEILMRNVIYRVLVEHGNEFRSFGRYVARYEYIDMLISLIGDFNRYNLGYEGLTKALSNISEADNKVLYDKIYDLCLLLKYIRELGEKMPDSLCRGMLLEGSLAEATRILTKYKDDESLRALREYKQLEQLISHKIVICGFGTNRNLTPQELNFMKALDFLGVDIDIYPLATNEAMDTNKSIYAFGMNTVKLIRDNFPKAHVLTFDTDKYTSSKINSSMLEKLGYAYAMEIDAKTASEVIDKDGAILLATLEQEEELLSYVCNEIIRLTREEGYRYRDIKIFSPDETTTDRLKDCFKQYQLDMFVDKNLLLNTTPIMRYVSLLIELPLHNYSVEDVLRMLRTGLVGAPTELVDIFENYCLKRNIVYKDKLFDKSKFILELDDDMTEEEKKKYRDLYRFPCAYENEVIEFAGGLLWNRLVNRSIVPLRDIADKIKDAPTLSSKATILAEYLDSKVRVFVEAIRDELVDRGDSSTALSIVSSYKEIMQLLSIMSDEINDVPISVSQFASLIKIDMRNKVQRTIPLMVDSVEIIDESNAQSMDSKVLFIVGAKATNFPNKPTSDTILTSREIEQLSDASGISIPNKSEMKAAEDFVTSSFVLNSASDKLYYLHLENDPESSVMTYISDFLGDKAKKLSFDAPDYGEAIARRHNFLSSDIDSDVMKEILARKKKEGQNVISVSAIENYNICPLKYISSAVLKIDEREDGTVVKTTEIGTLAHTMFEISFGKIIEGLKSDKNYLHKECEKLYGEDPLENFELTKTGEDYLKKLSEDCLEQAIIRDSVMPDKFDKAYRIFPGIKLRKIFELAYPNLVKDCLKAGYEPHKLEAKIHEMNNPIIYTTDNGTSYAFKGFIDRVDVKVSSDEANGEIYYRITDYKSGKKDIKMKGLFTGIQIQLPQYAVAIERDDDKNKVLRAGYIEVGIDKNKDKENFKYKDYENKLAVKDEAQHNYGECFDVVKKYANDIILPRTCEEMASGKSSALLNPDSKYICKSCHLRGLCGNSPANPTATDRYDIPSEARNVSTRSKQYSDIWYKAMKDRLDQNEEEK